MQKVEVSIGWEDNNYSAVAVVNGIVVVTHKNLEALKRIFALTLASHIEESLKDGDKLPDNLIKGNYILEYKLS